jgi:hypothetical protein
MRPTASARNRTVLVAPECRSRWGWRQTISDTVVNSPNPAPTGRGHDAACGGIGGRRRDAYRDADRCAEHQQPWSARQDVKRAGRTTAALPAMTPRGEPAEQPPAVMSNCARAGRNRKSTPKLSARVTGVPAPSQTANRPETAVDELETGRPYQQDVEREHVGTSPPAFCRRLAVGHRRFVV